MKSLVHRESKGEGRETRVSIIVPTRGRPGHAAACVAAILACPYRLDLIVVDQSDAAETEDALTPFSADRRMRYLRSTTRGVSAARNVGIALAQGELVAFTDDDCRVAADWVQRFEDVFEADPEVAVVCGRVRTPAGSDATGFAATFDPKERVYEGRLPPPGADWGISANMIVRRAVFARIGAFDEMLGVGSPLRSGAEPDLLFRAWTAGLKVVNASEVEVVHLGIRRHGSETRALLQGYLIGLGAAFAKHARLGRGSARRLYLRWLAHLIGLNLRNVLTLTRPTRVFLTLAFLHGSILSFRYRVDSETTMYVPHERQVIESQRV